MEKIFRHLMDIRKQLVVQQSSINECISVIDSLFINNMKPDNNEQADFSKPSSDTFKQFPGGVSSKRDKLKFILSLASEPMSAREIKSEIQKYGETLPNVDQSLVNLQKAGLIFFEEDNGRKKYFIKKKNVK